MILPVLLYALTIVWVLQLARRAVERCRAAVADGKARARCRADAARVVEHARGRWDGATAALAVGLRALDSPTAPVGFGDQAVAIEQLREAHAAARLVEETA